MNNLILKSKNYAQGVVTISGSKSLSNRVLLLAALAKGKTYITNLLDSDDTQRMVEALITLGVPILRNHSKSSALIAHNEDEGGLFQLDGTFDLNLGNAGTAFRPLIAALAFNYGDARFLIHGEERMHERPVADLVNVLRDLGCQINYLKEEGYAPLEIVTTRANSAIYNDCQEVNLPGNLSSQFLTSLLMIAPLITRPLLINIVGDLVSKPYIDITLDCMRKFGVEVEVVGDYQQFKVLPQKYYAYADDYLIEGDASSASYFLLAGALAGDVTVKGIDKNSIQGDVKFAEVLEQMGAKIEYGKGFIRSYQNKELLEATGYPLKSIDIDLNHIPDAAMGIAIAGCFCSPGEKTVIRNVYNWRIKETDRLTAMATELSKVGVKVVEGEDYLVVEAVESLKSATIATYKDHRMAMCFSLLSLTKDDIEITIEDPACVNKTFPTYFELFAKIQN